MRFTRQLSKGLNDSRTVPSGKLHKTWHHWMYENLHPAKVRYPSVAGHPVKVAP